MISWSIQNPICCITISGESNQCYDFAWLLPSSNLYLEILEQLAQCWDAGSSRISMCGDNLSSIVCVSQTSLGQIVLFTHSGNIRNEPCYYKLVQWFEINPGWLHQMKHQWFNKSFSLIVSDQYESMMKPHQPSAHTSLIVSRSWIQIRIHVSLYEMTFLDSRL